VALSHITQAYLQTLRTLREQITALEQQISQQLADQIRASASATLGTRSI
jgi:hypothetical protein